MRKKILTYTVLFVLSFSFSSCAMMQRMPSNQLYKKFSRQVKLEHNQVVFNQLENKNIPSKESKNFYYFQNGRWDLQLLNNKIIKIPHNNTENAIKKSIELLDRKDFKNYNIIDLRIDGKIIVEE